MLTDGNRFEQKDKKIDNDLVDFKLDNQLFVRLVAKGRIFKNVDFKYTIFDTCYLRNCVFDTCDFTGCRFVSCNLHGASFTGCKFDYAVFERTIVDSDILNSGCPGLENLKLRFARSLRMNYQQTGDAKSANLAIGVELDATEAHLSKAWRSNESYYRKKYAGWRRAKVFLEWVQFKVLDLIWGNGESAAKLLRAVVAVLLGMSVIDVLAFRDPQRLGNYFSAFLEAPQILLGVLSPPSYPSAYLTVIVFFRLVLFGFFMSIIIKRFNRR
jgi:hypothetical protein